MTDELDVGAAVFNFVVVASAILYDDIDEWGHLIPVNHNAVELSKFCFVKLAFLQFHSTLGKRYTAFAAIGIDAD